MSALKFRNLDVSPEDPVEAWGVEGIATAIDRGETTDWAKFLNAVQLDPYGKVARDLEQAIEVAESPGITALCRRALEASRASDKEWLAARFRRHVLESGMTREQLAKYLGTSRSRLSTYETGVVTPSAIISEKVRDLGEQRRKHLAP